MTDDLISRAAAVQRIANVSPIMQPADTQAALNYHLGYTDGRKAAEWAVRNIPAAQVQAEPVAITPPAPDDLDALVKRLRAPAYWMSGSGEGHEGENNAPREAADAITALRARPATVQVKPLDAETLADAFDAMWNAAIGVSHERQEGGAVASMLAEGFAAMGRVLRDRAALVASEPAPGSHQPPLPSEDAQGGEV